MADLVCPTSLLEKLTATSTFSSKKHETFKKCSPHKASKKARKWPEGKPKRPLSAYNYFFRQERERIIKIKYSTADSIPPKSRHGLSTGTGFGGLARSVAEKWKNMDKGERRIFQAQADNDKLRYQAEVEAWKTERELMEMGSVSSTTSSIAATDPTMPMPLPESSLYQGLNNIFGLALYNEMERAIGKMILDLSNKQNELFQQAQMQSDNHNHSTSNNHSTSTSSNNNNNDAMIFSGNNSTARNTNISQVSSHDLNLDKIQRDSFEPTPITNIVVSADHFAHHICITGYTSEADASTIFSSNSDIPILERIMSFDSDIFGMNDDADMDLLQVQSIGNNEDIFDDNNNRVATDDFADQLHEQPEF